MIIDTHAHLTDSKFNQDREFVLQRAKAAGVSYIFEIACETGEWDAALEFSKRDNIYASFGIHPQEAQNVSEKDFKKLEELLKNPKAIAVGEAGLDYHYETESKQLQKEVFIKQIDIAIKHNKPLIIHCREAFDDIINILKAYKTLPKGVVHYFTGAAQEAKFFTDRGFLLGVDGPVTYPKNETLRQVVAETDISKLLIETDCPYLSAQNYRGQRNEPAYVIETLKAIAAIKRISYEEAAKITTDNAKKLFNILEDKKL
ncbi:TatD family hydrolase [Endomicrobium proavitum]|uniref:TatD-related deoxyribonuclease n=1 Tax=Endomicrobium proavitum TaxID=1408281 RepID=A0A0G3WFL0_9BACT|nr:TatD family hydrolase [Endomicrobium proavitum]AKL97441.1 TatD-related deoxyribonuclease [Endomicrobium proavitum]